MENWLAAKRELEARIAVGVANPERPTALRIQEIMTEETVFQHRNVSEWTSDTHVKALLKGLKNSAGKPFEPITVLWVGDAWVVVDGHHRLMAYEAYEFDELVPVRVFEGSLDEAVGEALRANSHDKLTMNSKEKMNAAWRLVIGSTLSINVTVDVSLASRATVLTMRKVKNTLVEKTDLWYVGSLDWPSARAKYEGNNTEFGEGNGWLDKKARVIAEQLKKTFGKELSKHPKALWMALEEYDPNLAYAFCEEYGIDTAVLGHDYGEPEETDDSRAADF